ncbi:BTAD domain-containing putative transcriptional regulator [Blastococcus haudaquaticus]|uniref:Transcriptional regulatory protein, C terminal n=1 Tax=Blastococcus haudaquaticus TaxID=1938745 RepID=A0A286H367_9ACTN|nr:BTAD domain-containing putative transcriptional regulator [Blastococcus haudaquaticus]SOE02191.1 Transcriptional regulatory protein, C terminal [Blastococcus haudaquaticus]
MDAGQLRISLLGACTASSGDTPLDLGGRRQRAVLVVLLLARGEVVPVERLTEAVWGDHPPADAAGALQAYVSHLRRRLQPGSAARTRSSIIVSEGRGYAARLSPDAVDVWRFERLLDRSGTASARETAQLVGEALALWRGPPLAEWADEPWAEAEIARLAELRAVARERLMAARLALGEAALLVPDLESMAAEEPLREERWRLLALALYRASRQADALGALRRARTTLAEELGVDPGPALRELEQQVLAQSPALAVPVQRSGEPEPPPAAGPPDDLLDRERELVAVRAALDDLVAGEPRLLLVEGPAGIGKTRLLTEARRLAAQRSVRVLTARGSQLEKAFGFGAVRQLFEPELVAPERRDALLAGAAASARTVFDLAPGESPEGSFAVLHGLYWLAVNLSADGPLVLAVDDLQWCDSASLRWLAYLVRRLDAVPVLVVGTVRTGEQHPDEQLLTELSLEPAAVVVRPAPLSPGAIADLVERRLGGPVSPLFALACSRTTSGNPLLLRQLLRGLEADAVRPDAAHADVVVAVGSRAVSSMVLMRLRRLPGPAADVARAAAVLGDGASLPAVAALAGLTEAETAAGLAALARCEIVRDEQPMAFVHALVRDAVYRDLPSAERALRHERAAALLRDAGANDEQVAAHLLLAPARGDPATVEVLRRAARTAAERGASDSGVTLLRRALAELPVGELRCDVLTELGMLESRIDGAASTEHLLQAYQLGEDPRERATLAVAIARTEVFASPPGVATAFAREAARALPPDLDDHRQALLAIERTGGYMHGLEPQVWATTDPGRPVGDGLGARMLAATLAFEATVDGVDRDRAVRLARSALDGDRLWAVDDGLLWVVAANVRMLADDDLGDFWTRARALAHARGSLFTAMSVSVWEGYWRWRRGELDEALACLTAALDQDRMWGGSGIGLPYTRSFQIGCHLDRGDVAAARRAADAAVEGPAAGDGGRLLEHAVARLLAVEGRPADALARLDAIPMPVPVRNPVWNPWLTTAAIALDRLGRRGEAVSLMEEEVDRLRRWGAPTYLGTALCRLGELRGDDGLDDVREAVAVLAPTHAAVELARARCMLGLRVQVPDEEAVELLRAALDTALDRGALGIQRRARAGLARRGRPDESGRDAQRCPTSTERRIVELAAAGHGVRDVAQRLFLTPGTVQAVLESVSGNGLKFPSSGPADARYPATGRIP